MKMNNIPAEKFDKLPKWAQTFIEDLYTENDNLRNNVVELHKKNKCLRNYAPPIGKCDCGEYYAQGYLCLNCRKDNS